MNGKNHKNPKKKSIANQTMNKQLTYLDHAASTPLDPRVKETMDQCEHLFGNPGSANQIGKQAQALVENARKRIGEILGCGPHEIIFTASGTESINLAIQGIAKRARQGHIITTQVEHHAVLETCKQLEKEGFTISYLPVDGKGFLKPDVLNAELDKHSNTILVTVMYANNEIGTINSIKELAPVARARNVPFHTDACQAGQLCIDIAELGVDMMSLNGSKIYGPKGVGVLYKKAFIKIDPIMHGGGQEFGLRSGTENVAGIVGFAKALELIQEEREEEEQRLHLLQKQLMQGLLQISGTKLNGPEPLSALRVVNNVNIAFPGIEAVALLELLDKEGICASTGAACTTGNMEPSHVLLAVTQDYEIAQGSIRFTLGKATTEADIIRTIDIVKQCVEALRKSSQRVGVIQQVIA